MREALASADLDAVEAISGVGVAYTRDSVQASLVNGEEPEDIAEFDPAEFVDALFA